MSSSTAIAPGPPPARPAPPTGGFSPDLAFRLLATAVLVGGYYAFRTPLLEWLGDLSGRVFADTLSSSSLAALTVGAVLVALVVLWRRLLLTDPRFHAPLLITCI